MTHQATQEIQQEKSKHWRKINATNGRDDATEQCQEGVCQLCV